MLTALRLILMTSLTLRARVAVVIVRYTEALKVRRADSNTRATVQARRACARVNHCVYTQSMTNLTIKLQLQSILVKKYK